MHHARELAVKYSILLGELKKNHRARGDGGSAHDLLHDLGTAYTALAIAPDPKTAELAWVAGLIHSTDRLFPKGEVEPALTKYFEATPLTQESRRVVHTAVLNHTKPNDPADDPVTITLKDADRIASLGAYQIGRSAQYHPHIPLFDPRSVRARSKARYGKPHTIVDELYWVLEWEGWLRLPKAKEIAKPGFAFLRACIDDIVRQLTACGLHPMPEELRPLFE